MPRPPLVPTLHIDSGWVLDDEDAREIAHLAVHFAQMRVPRNPYADDHEEPDQ